MHCVPVLCESSHSRKAVYIEFDAAVGSIYDVLLGLGAQAAEVRVEVGVVQLS